MSAKKSAKLRIAQIEDIPGIWKLCANMFDEFRGSSLEDFQKLCIYRWQENPARTPEHVFGWVLESEDCEIVGFLGLVPVKFKIADRIINGASGTSWAVDPGYRAFGLELYNSFMGWGDKNFLIDTTASEIVGKLHSSLKLGMKKIPVDGIDKKYLWIINPLIFASTKVKGFAARGKIWRFLSKQPFLNLAGLLVSPRFLPNSRIRFKVPRFNVKQITGFDSEFDRFWENNKHDYSITVERKAPFLNWRHFRIPELLGRSYVFACHGNGNLLGYIAIQSRGYKNSMPGHFVVTDIFYDLNKRDVLYSLINSAFDFVRANDGTILEISGFSPKVMGGLNSQSPYVVRNSRWTYWYKAANKEISDLCGSRTWWPSGVDGDINI